MILTQEDELSQECLEDTILELRTSHMKKMPNLEITSGIDKQVVKGPLHLTKLGFVGDEHDLTFHGGVDKAVLGYCSSHYPGWQASFPERTDQFVPGGFGENFVVKKLNERNVCIGDIVSVGPEAVLQVSLPRMPCFKLNHRFSLKNFAPKTYQTSRTGWYYRVIKEGSVTAGDQIKVVERKWPDWPIARVQEYLHRNTENMEMNEALAAIESLGPESRNQFKNRVEKAKRAKEEQDIVWTDFRVTERNQETASIVLLEFEAVQPEHDAEKITPGSHVNVKLPDGLIRSYSVVGSNSPNHFKLGVKLEDNSRGGSKQIHESVRKGTILPIRVTRRIFKNAGAASNHCIIVGGIGITAFLAFAEKAKAVNYNFTIHYAVQSTKDVPFQEQLDIISKHIVYYDKSRGRRMSIPDIVKDLPWNTHVYVCGPSRMMDEAKSVVEAAGLTEEEVHFEAFQADTTGDPFEVTVMNKDEKKIQVPGTDSLLQVLRREFGDDIASSCEVGNCSTCKVKLRSGRVEHRGTALSDEEKKRNMLSCISRGIGRIEIEI